MSLLGRLVLGLCVLPLVLAGRDGFAQAPTAVPKVIVDGEGRPAVGFSLPGNSAGLVLGQSGRANDPLALLRRRMVSEQIRSRGVDQEAVLNAMEEVPRHLFVPADLRRQAYEDRPVEIGYGQTIYQPYMVARMTELLELKGGEKVLEIGTGSGYHSAVLSRIAGEVCSIEINDQLARDAGRTLRRLGFGNVKVLLGDGYEGWPDEAPFDAIILTAAPPRIPQPLVDQLKVGGRMVIPLGGELQNLLVVTKSQDGIQKRTVAPVRLPKMKGEARNRR